MRHLWAVLGLLLAGGCSSDRAAELAAMDDPTLAVTAERATNAQLCYVGGHVEIYGQRTYAAASRVAKERDLGDCTQAHRQCRALGYEVGTPSYLDCRAEVSREAGSASVARAEQQHSGDEMISTGLSLMGGRNPYAPRQTYPSTTTCMPFGAGVTCQNY